MTNTSTKRDVNGVLLLDKPLGLSSNKALQIVRAILRAAKAGHGGSLDPLATGLLPLCFGEATKFAQYLLDAPKRYFVTACLGISTTSGDAEGDIITQRSTAAITTEQVLTVLEQFRGRITQVPPIYSAIKQQGQPLYRLARQGKTVEAPPREVDILQLIPYEITQDRLTLAVQCSKGTYIRSLIADIGEALGCGAYVTGLRRLDVGPLAARQMVSLAQLRELNQQQGHLVLMQKHVMPVDQLLLHLPAVHLDQASTWRLIQGQKMPDQVLPGVAPGMVRLYQEDDHFLGLADYQPNGRLIAKRLLNTQQLLSTSKADTAS